MKPDWRRIRCFLTSFIDTICRHGASKMFWLAVSRRIPAALITKEGKTNG
jgi:hypothetical protein